MKTLKFDSDLLRSDLIKKRMIDLDISMTQASKIIGISLTNYSMVEGGDQPGLKTYIKILNWLGQKPERYIK